MKKLIIAAGTALTALVLLPASAFGGYLHLANVRDALNCTPGDCDIFNSIGRQPYAWSTYYRYSANEINQRIVFGPGFACFDVFKSTGDDAHITDVRVRDVCVA